MKSEQEIKDMIKKNPHWTRDRLVSELGLSYTQGELTESMKMDFKRLRELVELHKDEVELRDGVIYFKDYEFEDEGRENGYFIELHRIDDLKKLTWWIHHLCEKGWVNNSMIRKLIEIATKEIGLKMYEGEG